MLSNLFLARNLTSLTYCSSPTHPTKWCPKSTTVWWSWCSWIPFLLPVSIRPSPSITVYHRPSFPMIKTWKLTKNSTAVNDLVVAIQLFRHLTQRPRLTRSKQLPHEVTPKNPTSNKFTQDLPLGKPQQWKFNSFKCNRTTWHQVFLMRQHRKRSCRWVSRKLWECSPNFRGFNSYNGRVNPTKWLTSHLGVLPLLRKMIHLFLDEIWCFMVQGNNYFWGGGGYLVYSVDPFSDTIAYVNQMKELRPLTIVPAILGSNRRQSYPILPLNQKHDSFRDRQPYQGSSPLANDVPIPNSWVWTTALSCLPLQFCGKCMWMLP